MMVVRFPSKRAWFARISENVPAWQDWVFFMELPLTEGGWQV